MQHQQTFNYTTTEVFRDAVRLGICGGVGFTLFLPIAIATSWGFVAYWIGTSFLISRKNAQYSIIVAAIIPSLVSAAISVTALSLFTPFFNNEYSDAYGMFAYLLAVGLFFAFPTAILAPRLEL